MSNLTDALIAAKLMGNGGGGGGSLPSVTEADNGDVLTVIEGAWGKATPSGGGGVETKLYDMLSNQSPMTSTVTSTELGQHQAVFTFSDTPVWGFINGYSNIANDFFKSVTINGVEYEMRGNGAPSSPYGSLLLNGEEFGGWGTTSRGRKFTINEKEGGSSLTPGATVSLTSLKVELIKLPREYTVASQVSADNELQSFVNFVWDRT